MSVKHDIAYKFLSNVACEFKVKFQQADFVL